MYKCHKLLKLMILLNQILLKIHMVSFKKHILKKYCNLVRNDNQPLLCTYLDAEIKARDNDVILYSPRSKLSGSVICHFGEIHHDVVKIDQRIDIKPLI